MKKGKKRKHAAHDGPTGRAAKRGPSSAPPERLEEDTVAYFEEIRGQLLTVTEPEERALLVGNALREATGKELLVACHPSCSRALEAALPAAPAEALLRFAFPLTERQAFCQLAASACGSHVAEALLKAAGEAAAQRGGAAQQAQHSRHSAREVIERATLSVTLALWEFLTDRFASHVLRRLLAVLAGRVDLAGPRGGPRRDSPGGLDGSDFLAAEKEKSGGRGRSGPLHAHAAAQGRVPAPSATPFPTELGTLADALIEGESWNEEAMTELAHHQTACPCLQALLQALRRDEERLCPLVAKLMGAVLPPDDRTPEGEAAPDSFFQPRWLEGVPRSHVQGLMQGSVSSHLFEAIFASAPFTCKDALFHAFLKGALADLAQHPSANFALQAYLASLDGPKQVRACLTELRDVLPALLSGKRGGVVAALVAAAGRLPDEAPPPGGTPRGSRKGARGVKLEVARALADAVRALPPSGGAAAAVTSGQGQGLVAGLAGLGLAPDSALGEGQPHRGLSPLGCSMLVSLLSFPQEAAEEVVKGLEALSPAATLHLSADSFGSRVMQALLESPAASRKVKRRVGRKLLGSFGALAKEAGGSHVVQAVLTVLGPEDKEALVAEVAGEVRDVRATVRGQILLQRLGVDLWLQSPEAWRRREQSASSLKAGFAEFLNPPRAANEPAQSLLAPPEAAQPAQSQEQKEEEEEAPPEAAKAAESPEQEEEEEKEEEEKQGYAQGKRKGSKRKSSRRRAAAAETASLAAPPEAPPQSTAQAEQEEERKNMRKGRKRRAAAEANGVRLEQGAKEGSGQAAAGAEAGAAEAVQVTGSPGGEPGGEGSALPGRSKRKKKAAQAAETEGVEGLTAEGVPGRAKRKENIRLPGKLGKGAKLSSGNGKKGKEGLEVQGVLPFFEDRG